MPSGWKFWPDREPGPLDHAYVQTRWVRPYRPGPLRLLVGGAVGCLVAFTAFVGVAATIGAPTLGARLVTAAFGLTVTGSLTVLATRLLTAGVWVNDAGVRVLTLFRTRELPWTRIADVRRVLGPARVLGSPLRTHDGETVWLVLTDATDLETPLTDLSPDFVGRPEAYEMAAGAVERWFEETRPEPS